MTVVCVTGTPACGKTTLSKKIAEDLSFRYIDVKEVIKNNNLVESFDKNRDCNVIDTEKLNDVLMKLDGDLVIDSHMSHDLPPEFVDVVVVVKCDISLLKERLEKRGYSQEKVRENLDSEIFDVCLTESLDFGHENVVIFDSDSDYVALIEEIKKIKS